MTSSLEGHVMPWHADLWIRLQARRARHAIPHALLLSGPAGLGKRAFVRRFAQGLLCTQAHDGVPCGECRSCRLFIAGTHPDYVALGLGLRKDGEQRSDIVVDQIRELSARLSLSSQFGGWQIACIDPVDAMNTAAANALLKTLEEPSSQTLLLLVADAPWRLPQTIRSRCQRVDFHLPPREQAAAWLQENAVADAAGALDAAAGNPGLARQWAQNGALARRREVREDLVALAAGRGEAMDVAKRWLNNEPEQRLWFAAQAAVDETRARAATTTPPLGSGLDIQGLSQWYAAANRARESLRGPLRGDLVLLELLARWR